MVKNCSWGTCNSDSRYPVRLINSEGKSVKFSSLPSLKKDKVRGEARIKACCRRDKFVCNKFTYNCVLHFIGNNEPTEGNPEPIPATMSRIKVRYILSFLRKLHEKLCGL